MLMSLCSIMLVKYCTLFCKLKNKSNMGQLSEPHHNTSFNKLTFVANYFMRTLHLTLATPLSLTLLKNRI